MKLLLGPAAIFCAAFAMKSHAQPRVFINTFDFDFSINLPGEPIVDAVVEPGTLVIWVLWDDFHNTVACVGQAEYWDSPIMSTIDTWEHVFTIPGVYNYYCSPHGFDNGDGTATGMTGSVTVLPAPSVIAVCAFAAAAACRRRRA